MATRLTPSALFEVVDSGTTRSDSGSRREVKYAFEQMDVGNLRRLLEVNCRRLIHNDRVSVVRSIYFDDARLSACRANLDGCGIRRKLRLRWYNSIHPAGGLYFEIKWREGQVTGKHRLQLKSGESLTGMSYSRIRRGLQEVIPDALQRDVLKFNEPIVIVQYNREHFATDDGLRITLDYDLTYYDQTGRQTISTEFPRRIDGMVILEGKTPVGREAELSHWLHPLAPRVGRCSKYVHGCCQLGLIGGREHQ